MTPEVFLCRAQHFLTSIRKGVSQERWAQKTMPSDVLVFRKKAWWAGIISLSLLALATIGRGETQNRMNLRENWLLQSSCKVNQPGEILSTTQFSPDHWYKTAVPSTVLAAQVANGEFKDIEFGKNLRKLPGMDYPIGQMYSNLDMPSESPYACSWWYRTEFQLPQDFRGRKVWLHFNGINYRANWMQLS